MIIQNGTIQTTAYKRTSKVIEVKSVDTLTGTKVITTIPFKLARECYTTRAEIQGYSNDHREYLNKIRETVPNGGTYIL